MKRTKLQLFNFRQRLERGVISFKWVSEVVDPLTVITFSAIGVGIYAGETFRTNMIKEMDRQRAILKAERDRNNAMFDKWRDVPANNSDDLNFDLYEIVPEVFLGLFTFMFCLSLVGLALNHRNFFFSLVCLELILFSLGLSFSSFSIYYSNIEGQLYALLLLGVAASEAVIGLCILLSIFKTKKKALIF